jgi:hypothetical protein
MTRRGITVNVALFKTRRKSSSIVSHRRLVEPRLLIISDRSARFYADAVGNVVAGMGDNLVAFGEALQYFGFQTVL